MKPKLTIAALQGEASVFIARERGSAQGEPALYGVTDGKFVGTCLEQKFTRCLAEKYECEQGSSASGIDLPGLGVDIKTTALHNRNPPVLSPQQHKKFLAWATIC